MRAVKYDDDGYAITPDELVAAVAAGASWLDANDPTAEGWRETLADEGFNVSTSDRCVLAVTHESTFRNVLESMGHNVDAEGYGWASAHGFDLNLRVNDDDHWQLLQDEWERYVHGDA